MVLKELLCAIGSVLNLCGPGATVEAEHKWMKYEMSKQFLAAYSGGFAEDWISTYSGKNHDRVPGSFSTALSTITIYSSSTNAVSVMRLNHGVVETLELCPLTSSSLMIFD